MTQRLKWQDDPVVLLEKAVQPIVSLIPTAVVRNELGHRPDVARISATFDTATRMLRHTSAEMLRSQNAPFTPDQFKPIAVAADVIEDYHRRLIRFLEGPNDKSEKMTLLALYTDVIVDTIEAAIDAFRSVFISFVIARQGQHSKRADDAIERLNRISKQIFFISINASVEAARVGEHGRGFQQISSDIRALSQSAQDATSDLSGLVS